MAATRKGRRKSSNVSSQGETEADSNMLSPIRRSSRLRSASHDSPLAPSPTTKKASDENKDNKKGAQSATKAETTPKRKVGRPRSKSVPSKLEALPAETDNVIPVVTKDSSPSSEKASKPKRARSLSKDKGNKSPSSAARGRKRSDSVASASSLAKEESAVENHEDISHSKRKSKTSSKDIVKTSDQAEQNQKEIAKKRAPLALTASKIATISAEKIKNNLQKKKTPKNELTNFIPGYTAALRLDSSSLNSQRPGLENLRKRALVTDKFTSAFVKGTVANQQQTQAIVSSKPSSSSSLVVASSFKKGTKREAPNHAGDKWFGMVPTPLTDDVKHDLNVIRSRNYLDPKRFYKSSDKASKFLQVGTVVEGNTEFNSSRLTKKQRRSNLTEELMADPATAEYAKGKYKKMQQAKSAKWNKQNRHKKRGKRQHM